MKYVLVTGGVISGIGKGIIASSTGLLLKSMGYRVTAIKIDPYLNLDAGTMSPNEHGEVFVLDDGGEADLDLGNYERFLSTCLTAKNNITTGKIYDSVIRKERRGDYLGKTVQVIPHVTNEIQNWIMEVSQLPDSNGDVADICIIELGGTVGDIESAPFVEAMRQFQFKVGNENFCSVHVSLVPVVGSVGEQKTKPTQASVRELRGLGLMPDIIMCRCSQTVDQDIRDKISMFCHVPPSHVFGVHDCSSIYHVPIVLEQQNLPAILTKRLELNTIPKNPEFCNLFSKWKSLSQRFDRPYETVKIALVGKYVNLHDSYLSVTKALEHAAIACNLKLEVAWVNSEHLEKSMEEKDFHLYHKAWSRLSDGIDGILVPGGFGTRGIEGKIAAIKRAREKNIPFLGICLGFQLAVIEFCRNVVGIEDATSEEFAMIDDKLFESKNLVVISMPEISVTELGGTMRLGRRTSTFVSDDSVSRKLYGSDKISERHRHRFEVNTTYRKQIEQNGMVFVAEDDKAERMEILEIPNHPYFVATQFHPEFLSRPLKPSPPFLGLILASAGKLKSYFAGELPDVAKYSPIGSRSVSPEPKNLHD